MEEKPLDKYTDFEAVGWIVGIAFGVYSLLASLGMFKSAYAVLIGIAVVVLMVILYRYLTVWRTAKRYKDMSVFLVLLIVAFIASWLLTMKIHQESDKRDADARREQELVNDIHDCVTKEINPRPCLLIAMLKEDSQINQSNTAHSKAQSTTIYQPAPKPEIPVVSSHERELGLAKHIALCYEGTDFANSLSASMTKAQQRIQNEREEKTKEDIAKNPGAAHPPMSIHELNGLVSAAAMPENSAALSLLQSHIRATDKSLVTKTLSDIENNISADCGSAMECVANMNVLCRAINGEIH